jgi:hypothetical protein
MFKSSSLYDIILTEGDTGPFPLNTPVNLSHAVESGLIIGNGFEDLKREYAASKDKKRFAIVFFGKHKGHFDALRKQANSAEEAFIKDLIGGCSIFDDDGELLRPPKGVRAKFVSELWCLNHTKVWFNVVVSEKDKTTSGSRRMTEIIRVSINNLLYYSFICLTTSFYLYI